MIKDISSIKIGSIWNQGRGASFKDEIEAVPNSGSALTKDITFNKPIIADLMVLRLQDGVTVILENLSTETEQVCSRCLEKYLFPLKASSAERHFFDEMPERDYDPFEVFLINKQEMSVDLSEMLRQEIILHFPMIPVCSERCKGLCPGCHINLNISQTHRQDCPGTPEETLVAPVQKPFSHLKDLFKNN